MTKKSNSKKQTKGHSKSSVFEDLHYCNYLSRQKGKTEPQTFSTVTSKEHQTWDSHMGVYIHVV